MIKCDELKKIMCRVDGEPLVFDSQNVIAAGPYVKDGQILKRAVLRATPKAIDGVEFVVHTEYMEERFILPDGTIDSVGTTRHYDGGDYTTDFEQAVKRFVERCQRLAPLVTGALTHVRLERCRKEVPLAGL